MRYLLTTLLLTVYATLVCARPTITQINPEDDAVDSYDVIPYPGADTITLNGTLSEVYAQVLEINPNYEQDWSNGDTTVTESESTSNLERRADENADIHCYHKINKGWVGPAEDGIEHLRQFKLPPGLKGNTCKKVSCSGNTAISWCNDRSTLRVLPSFNNIADGAQVILNKCKGKLNTVGGWLGHNDDWRVFVDQAKC
ncbi:hypothetical protein BDV18DRAFT_167982 [Aspergillus unguis]